MIKRLKEPFNNASIENAFNNSEYVIKFNVETFAADWAYTMDGSQIGELEYENFNAASAIITVQGKIVHPGYAKGKMINSILLAQEFMAGLPKNETPEQTENYEGLENYIEEEYQTKAETFVCVNSERINRG